jgi:hypothetical protein
MGEAPWPESKFVMIKSQLIIGPLKRREIPGIYFAYLGIDSLCPLRLMDFIFGTSLELSLVGMGVEFRIFIP